MALINEHKLIKQQANLWVDRLDRGLSAEQKQELQAWARQSVAHRTALFNVASLWDDLSIVQQLHKLLPEQTKPAKPSLAIHFGMAGCIGLVCALSIGALFGFNPFNTSPIELAITEHQSFSTTYGEQAQFTLNDGSIIELNTNSLVLLNFSTKQRNIELVRGEATFDVAKDSSRPFKVTVGERVFTALGTVFNVQKNSNQAMELTVTEGKVLVTEVTRTEPIMPQHFTSLSEHRLLGTLVESGQQAVIASAEQQSIHNISAAQVQQDLAWRHGMLIFDGESLLNVLQEINRYSVKQFTLAEPELGQIKVSGLYRAKDVDGFLASLESNFAIRARSFKTNALELFSAPQ